MRHFFDQHETAGFSGNYFSLCRPGVRECRIHRCETQHNIWHMDVPFYRKVELSLAFILKTRKCAKLKAWNIHIWRWLFVRTVHPAKQHMHLANVSVESALISVISNINERAWLAKLAMLVALSDWRWTNLQCARGYMDKSVTGVHGPSSKLSFQLHISHSPFRNSNHVLVFNHSD